ncbi:1086_t:CDS:2 [Paraglomus brasilianum]|uniref:1086_t:CDS:1 n=1 Tax=Paraglomus brasilianum TaxID=144538 RepID=A0A9N9D6H3_9GLOM|nr:1086_t:CDS:2 [Paraglomus brasilianum]
MRKRAHSTIAQIVCRLAEAQFASFNDSLKKCGPNITKMKEWAGPPPQELNDLIDTDNKVDDVEQTQSESLYKISSKINTASQASQSSLLGDQSSRESYSSAASSKQLTSNGQLLSSQSSIQSRFHREIPIPPARPPTVGVIQLPSSNVKPASAETALKLSFDRLDSLQSSTSDSITNASPVTPPVYLHLTSFPLN